MEQIQLKRPQYSFARCFFFAVTFASLSRASARLETSKSSIRTIHAIQKNYTLTLQKLVIEEIWNRKHKRAISTKCLYIFYVSATPAIEIQKLPQSSYELDRRKLASYSNFFSGIIIRTFFDAKMAMSLEKKAQTYFMYLRKLQTIFISCERD